MTKSIITAHSGNSQVTSTTGNNYAGVGGPPAVSGSETNRNVEWWEAGDSSNLHAYLSANGSTAACTIALRNGSVDTAQALSIGAGSTGEFSDLVNTETWADGDNCSIRFGAHTTAAYTCSGVWFDFTPTDSSKTIQRLMSTSGSTYSTDSGTLYYNPAGGSLNGATEADEEAQARNDCSAGYFSTRISSNARTTASTLGLRIERTDSSLVVSVGASTTGTFSDLGTNTPSLVTGDRHSFFLRNGTGTGGITVQHLSCGLRTSGSTYQTATAQSTSSFTTDSAQVYSSLHGHGGTQTSQPKHFIRFKFAAIIDKLSVKVRTNTRSTACTVAVHDNGSVTGLAVSIGSGTTGYFEDNTNTDSVPVDGVRTLGLLTGTGGGVIAITSYATRVQEVSSTKPKIKISGSFVTKPVKVKASGSWAEKQMKIKVSGSWVNV